LSSVVPELPEAVDAVMERALARERDARFPDAATMREAVQALLRRERPAAPKHRAAGLVQPTVTPMQGATEVALDAHRSGSWSDSGVSGRSARMRVDAVAAAPKPREPSRLELDVPQGWKPGGVEASKVPSPVGTGRTAWGWYALMIALVVAGMGTWFFARKIDEGFDKIEESIDGVEVGDDAAPGETVLILVRPTPKDATVYVDGVQHDERTIEVPKSDESIEIRAQAPGYKPYTIQLTPQRTRQLELKMEKL
jgi:hypothetical protein